MKILWVSNAPWSPSGYGTQTAQVGLRIARAGYEIEFVANDGSRGNRDWNGLLVRGSGSDRYSRDSVREDLDRSGADWVISLYDVWVYTDRLQDPFKGLTNVMGWVPVDHYPTPLSLYEWLSEHSAIAMSQFGYDCLRATSEGFAIAGKQPFPVTYAPHAIDDEFVPRESRFREFIDVPADAYLVGIVAANNGTKVYDRKGFSDMAHALGPFMRRHPDAYVYLHTLQTTFDGIDIPRLLEFTGVDADRLRWADQYAIKKQEISGEQMSHIYSAFDVLLATSRGEGFGIPVIEAQACGVPVIASNWTAQAELVGDVWTQSDLGGQRHPSGWLVGVDPDWDWRHGADFAKPRIAQIIGALGEAYEARGDRRLRDAAIGKAEPYRADAVFDRYWRPILAGMAEPRLASSPAVAEVLSRKARRKAAARARRAA